MIGELPAAGYLPIEGYRPIRDDAPQSLRGETGSSRRRSRRSRGVEGFDRRHGRCPGAEPSGDLRRGAHDPEDVPARDRLEVAIGVAPGAELLEHAWIRRDVGELLAHGRDTVVVAAHADRVDP